MKREKVEVVFRRIRKITEKAVLFEYAGNPVWVPKSLLEDWTDPPYGDYEGPWEVNLPEWFAEREELD